MLLVAGKPVRNGDETVADYGDDYIFDDEPVVHAQHRTDKYQVVSL